ncbi:D-proline reductase (dithiol) PrdB [Facklamia miroungae]|uniref:D-proline reductase (Dithiol) PrdB n=2 Tax=Facklamia miroungae TaxID=120956 RepID=A0A1G7QNL0_9LACT|nr:glycine/sarcosine/betaine reductase selenoprotein B family protein [Facklamia miroungae]NKZ29009.1 hypothetical protein [Facklamia miroungae]SDG00121.1 D-proline reductase (dithiol) PrdB [Facklamia miroungae]
MKKRSIKENIIAAMAKRMVVTIEEPPQIVELTKPLSKCNVAFITTAGAHLKVDQPFNIKGDHTYRVIPGKSKKADIMITHDHYDHGPADQDLNCVFPLEMLQEMADQGRIGSVAPRHYGLMGYIPKVNLLMNETAPEIAGQLVADQVDLALLSPG